MILLPVLTLIQLFIFNANCLMDWPLTTRLSQNAIFHATLTDEATGDSFDVKEYIIETGVTANKIEITSKHGKAEIYYNDDYENGLGEYQRLVIQDGRCDLFTYKIFWDQNLLNTEKPLANLVLMLGPSLLYRINDADPRWEKGNDENVRGVRLQSSHARIDNSLNVTYYYKSLGYNDKDDLEKPRRIVLEGTDPLGLKQAEDEKLIMDFHVQLETYDSLEKLVEITPGIGCPFYLSKAKPFPKLKSNRISMVIHETTLMHNGPGIKSTNEQFDVNEDEAILRRVSSSSGINAVYDYNLGLAFTLKDSKCSILPLDDKAPWLNEKKNLDLNHFLWLNLPFKYLGQIYLDYESRYVVKAWEAVEYNLTLQGFQYDKVVTTLYFVGSHKSDTFEGYDLVAANRNCYSKKSNNGYILLQAFNRKFYEMKPVSYDTESTDQFPLDRCFPDQNSKVTLAYHLNYIGKLERTESFINRLRQDLKSLILIDHKISPLRVLNIDLVLDSRDIIAYATFSDSPKIEDSLKKETMIIKPDYLKQIATHSIESEIECLRFLGKITKNIRKVIHCNIPGRSSKCYRVETESKIIEDKNNGYNCTVFDLPLKNLNRLDNELELKQIYPQMVKKSIKSIELNGNTFKIVKVIDVTQSRVDRPTPFILRQKQSKLTDLNGAVKLADVKNLGDCYRSCVRTGQSVCQTFSFCEYADQVVCLATNTFSDQIISDNVTKDISCNIYSKNYLLDYFKIRERRFRVSPSIAQKVPLQSCATSCYSTNDCYSFQYCNGLCTFAGYYTDSGTEHYSDCDIYSPKKSHLYRMTGHQVPIETLHTEINLNMDQCASLCYDWKSGDDACQSFGYCLEGGTPSTCFLSKNQVSNDRTSIVDNTTCYTYELTSNRYADEQNVDKVSRGLTSGQAAGIILSLAFVGLIIGLAVQKLVFKIKSNQIFSNFNQFSWSRQTDAVDLS